MKKVRDVYFAELLKTDAMANWVCTQEENAQCMQLRSQGQPLPEGIMQSPGNPNIFVKSGAYYVNTISDEDMQKHLWIEGYRTLKLIKRYALIIAAIVATTAVFTLIAMIAIATSI